MEQTQELSALHAELERVRAEAVAKERQLERYAEDLRETFKSERARSAQLRASYAATVRALANAVEVRDAYTGKHAERVAAYGMRIADELDTRLTEDPEIEFGFLLHDIGKVAVPDTILYKPHRLDPEEWLLMKAHANTGWEILRDVEFLGAAKLVVRHHHERWDGAGYPDRLAGEDIPLAARVFAVADTLDALTTERPYRQPVTLREAREVIAAESGKQFDPAAAAAFATIPDSDLEQIRRAAS